MGDGGGRRGAVGDCRVNFLPPFNNFVCQTEVGTCVKDNKRSVLFYSNGPREWTLDVKYIGNVTDRENNNEAQNLSP